MVPLRKRLRAQASLRLVMVVIAALLMLCSWSPTPTPGDAEQTPLVGFSFSPKLASELGEDPLRTLRALLTEVQPGLVRLPVYWDTVAPEQGRLDFAEYDALLGAVESYDAEQPGRRTRVVLVVGARNLGSPELHAPGWLQQDGHRSLAREMRSQHYLDYLQATVRRYASNSLLYGWQIENEPLDSTNPKLGDIAVPSDVVANEVRQVHRLDPSHPVVVTTFNSANVALDDLGWLFQRYSPWTPPGGHPRPTLQLGDVLGLNAYVVAPNAFDVVSVNRRIDWKRDQLAYWVEQARAERKQVWITEMQAAPWQGVDGFTPADLQRSAELYRDTGVSAIFLWGAEEWMKSPAWLRAARKATATMQGSSAGWQ